MWIQKLKKSAIPLGIVAVAIFLFIYMKSTKPVQAPVAVKEKVWMVETLPVKLERLAPVQTLYGQVESSAMVMAATPVAGVVAEVLVKEGQVFKAGEVLVRMADADLNIPLQQAKADVADAKAQIQLQELANKTNVQKLAHERKILQFKRDNVERTEKLINRDLTSKSALELAKEGLLKQEYAVVGMQLSVEESQLKTLQLRAKLEKFNALLQQAELNLQRGQVVAPYDGRVAKVEVSEGSRVNAGTVLLRFYGLSSLELRAKLPAVILADVHQALAQSKPLFAFYQAQGQTEKLTLDRLAGEASTSGVEGFFALPARLLNKRPGDLLAVQLQGQAMDGVVALPYSAIYGSDRIYLIEEGRLVAQSVELVGSVQRNGLLWALIKADVKSGAKVCVTHLPNAVSGLKISEVLYESN